MIKRLFRIYPTFFFAITASLLLHIYFPPVLEHYSSEWAHDISYPAISLPIYLQHLIMLGTKEAMHLDGVMWSLVHEMRISLIFPFILAGVIRYKWRAVAVCWALSAIIATGIGAVTGNATAEWGSENELYSWLYTAYFIVFFTFGIMVAFTYEKLEKMWVAAPRILKYATAAFVIIGFLKVDFKTNSTDNPYLAMLIDYVHGLCAAMLIFMAIASKTLRNFLNWPVFVWLGAISYSVYLVHLPVIYVVNQALSGQIPFGVLSAVIIAATLLIAHITYVMVERPFIQLGKKVITKLA